jgi:hypothetical protein
LSSGSSTRVRLELGFFANGHQPMKR